MIGPIRGALSAPTSYPESGGILIHSIGRLTIQNKPERHDRRRINEVAMRQLYKHSESQLRSLQRAVFVSDITEDVLRRVGVQRGMRLLDLGCGTGETCLL